MPDAEGTKAKIYENDTSGEEYTDSHRSATMVTCSTIESITENASLTLELNNETACREESSAIGDDHTDNAVSVQAVADSTHEPKAAQCTHLEATPAISQDCDEVAAHALHSMNLSFNDAPSASDSMPHPPGSSGCLLDQAGQAGQGDSAIVSLREVRLEGDLDDTQCDDRSPGLHATDIQRVELISECTDTNLVPVGKALPEEQLPVDGPDMPDENHQPPESHEDEDPLVLLHEQAPFLDPTFSHRIQPAQHPSDRTGQDPADQDDLGAGLPPHSSIEHTTVGSVAEDIECWSDSAGDCGDGASWSAGIAPDGVYCKPCHIPGMVAMHLDILSVSGPKLGGAQPSVVQSCINIPKITCFQSSFANGVAMHAVAPTAQHDRNAPGTATSPEDADPPFWLPIPADNSPRQIVRSVGGGPACPSLRSDASSAFTVDYEDEEDDLEFGDSSGESSSDREALPQSAHASMDQDVVELCMSTVGVDVCSPELGHIHSDSATEGVHVEDAGGSVTDAYQPELQEGGLRLGDIQEAMGGLDAAEIILDMPLGGPDETGVEIESLEQSDEDNDASSGELGCFAGEYVAVNGVNRGAQVGPEPVMYMNPC